MPASRAASQASAASRTEVLTQLKDMQAARFTVLCDVVMHQSKEEEGEMFLQRERARLDGEVLAQRRAELMPAKAEDCDTTEDEAATTAAATPPGIRATSNPRDPRRSGANRAI